MPLPWYCHCMLQCQCHCGRGRKWVLQYIRCMVNSDTYQTIWGLLNVIICHFKNIVSALLLFFSAVKRFIAFTTSQEFTRNSDKIWTFWGKWGKSHSFEVGYNTANWFLPWKLGSIAEIYKSAYKLVLLFLKVAHMQ